MDLFERMPNMLVALSPRDYQRINAMIETDNPPRVKVLYLAAYVDPPTRDDIQWLYETLWVEPRYRLVQNPVIIIPPPEPVRIEIVGRLRELGYDDDLTLDMIEIIQPLIH